MRTKRMIQLTMAAIFCVGLAASHADALPGRDKAASRRKGSAAVVYRAELARSGMMITPRGIRRAVVQGVRDYFNEPKFGGAMTRGAWNRIDLRSLSLKDVTIQRGRRDSFGYRLKLGEFPFTAHLTARQGRPGEKKTITMQVESVIELRKKMPREAFGVRVQTTPELRAQDAAHLNDTSTAYWLD